MDTLKSTSLSKVMHFCAVQQMAAENKELMRQALEDVSPSVVVSVRVLSGLGDRHKLR